MDNHIGPVVSKTYIQTSYLFIYYFLFRVQAETSIINVNDKRTEIKVIGLRSYTEYKIRLRNVQTNSFSKFIPGK